MNQEFVRVGYYINNEYDDPLLKENPPEEICYDKIVRNVLSEKPRVTRIPVKWDSTDELDEPNEQIVEECSFSNTSDIQNSRINQRMEIEVGVDNI